MRKDEIVELEVNSLIPYARNNKIHNRKQLDKLKAVIKEHGYDVLIVVDEDDVILKGHGRREAIQELGWDKVKCIKRHGLTKTEKQAIRIEDNKITELAEWDNEMLALEVAELVEFGIEAESLGFDIEEITRLNNVIENDLDYSDKNKEIDINDFEDEMILKLKYSEEEYNFVLEKLNEISNNPEKALLELLNERT